MVALGSRAKVAGSNDLFVAKGSTLEKGLMLEKGSTLRSGIPFSFKRVQGECKWLRKA